MPRERPGLFARFGALTRGEEPLESLLAYRRAGAAAHAQMDQTPVLWARLAIGGVNPWTAASQESAQLLCTWNAFVPQLLAEQLLEAEARAGTNRAGFLPAVSAEQARRLFRDVEPWLTRARRAGSDPSYRVDLEVALPGSLPPWVDVEPCPATHLQAMLNATDALRVRVQVDLGNLRDLPGSEMHATGHQQLLQLVDEAAAATDYARAMLHPGMSLDLHAEVESRLKFSLSRQHHVGQLCALPALLTGFLRPPAPRPTPYAYPAIPSSGHTWPVERGHGPTWEGWGGEASGDNWGGHGHRGSH